MSVAEVKSDVTGICHPDKDGEVVEAKMKVLEAHAAVEEAKDRFVRLQRILRESRDGIERAESRLDKDEAERDVLKFGRDEELARRQEEQTRKQVHARLLPHYKQLYGDALRRIQLMHKQVAAPLHAEARAIRNQALSHGVKLEVCEWHEFGAQERGFTPRWLDWPRLVGMQGYWVDD